MPNDNALKQLLIAAALNTPIELREALKDPDVEKALIDIGVFLEIKELHVPSVTARKSTGVGDTLCGTTGTRHKEVTCKRCLTMAASRSVGKVPTMEFSPSKLEKTLLAQKSRGSKKGGKGQRGGGGGGG